MYWERDGEKICKLYTDEGYRIGKLYNVGNKQYFRTVPVNRTKFKSNYIFTTNDIPMSGDKHIITLMIPEDVSNTETYINKFAERFVEELTPEPVV